ncbi:cytochrome P450, partial [Trifolium medium]|nr:cytochrome P450 [Trifolium medium]
MFVLAPYGSYWRQVRKITTLEILTHRRVEQLHHFRVLEVQNSIKEFYDVWCSKKNDESSNYVLVELKQWFTQLSFNIVLPMLVGKRYFGAINVIDKEEAERCIKALKEMMHLFGVFTVGDALPFLKWFDFGGHVTAMKETSKELDKILNFMDVMISSLDGTTIEGFDADTIIKSTIL